MGSTGGGSGVSGGGANHFVVLDSGNLQLPNGAEVNLSTAEGLAALSAHEALLDAEQRAFLEGFMNGIGFTRAGNTWVPRDDYEIMRQELGLVGPRATDEGMTQIEIDIVINVYEPVGVPSPYHPDKTPQLYDMVQGSPQFGQAVDAMGEYLVNPTAANKGELFTRMMALESQFPFGNIMELLFLVFRESIEDTNENKRYFLQKLQEYNKLAEALSEKLRDYVKASETLSEMCDNYKEYPDLELDEHPEKASCQVVVERYDLTTLGPDGQAVVISSETKMVRRDALNDIIKQLEADQETVRNKRQMATTAFQNFDQKSNQLYNLTASALKSLNEMRHGVVRNML